MGIAFTVPWQPHTKPLYLFASFHSCPCAPTPALHCSASPHGHIPLTPRLSLQGGTVQQGFRVSPIPSQRASLHFLHAEHQTECLPWAPDIHVATSLMTIWGKVLWGIRADGTDTGERRLLGWVTTGIKAMLTFLCIFPSHEHEFTGFLLRAHQLLASLGRPRKAQLLCWRSLKAQLQSKLEMHGRTWFQTFLLSRWRQWKITVSQYPERQSWIPPFPGSVIWWLWRGYLAQSGSSINKCNWRDDSKTKWIRDRREVAAATSRQWWCV